MNKITEKKIWDDTVLELGDLKVSLSSHWSYNLLNDPKRLAFVLSRYKFAAKMGCKDKVVLELGCSEGIGASILSEIANKYVGIDSDQEAIAVAKNNFKDLNNEFLCADFLGKTFGVFDTVVSLDVIEHIYEEYEDLFFDTCLKNLNENGICIIGTPNITSVPYASKASQMGHVNMYSHERLFEVLKKYFFQVLPFSMNDEVVHTGFAPMGHYLMFVACHKK